MDRANNAANRIESPEKRTKGIFQHPFFLSFAPLIGRFPREDRMSRGAAKIRRSDGRKKKRKKKRKRRKERKKAALEHVSAR